MDAYEAYLASSFFRKYQGTYFSDSILKDVFGQKLRRHSAGHISQMSYEDIYQLDVQLIQDLLTLYEQDYHWEEKQVFDMLYSSYLDPDGAAVREFGDVPCSADGLISIKRLFIHEGMRESFLRGYTVYRKKPIFFFPQERGGINMMRASVFGDRIDHTLYDIKRYLEAETQEARRDCKLSRAFALPLTEKWLKAMGRFEAIVDWWGVRGIFTTENYEVLDLEKSDGSVITAYRDDYPWSWSKDYYANLKARIQMYLDRDEGRS